jgi:AcrR family transcriptional regulator
METGKSRRAPRQETTRTARLPSGKQRILEAAERLFASRGYQSVSAAEIAREAGVAHGLLFHHFKSMDDLYAEVSRLAAEKMDATQLAAFKGHTAREQIASFLRAHMKAMKQRQADAVFRPRMLGTAVASAVSQIWETSRQRAIDRVFDSLGVASPTRKMRVCLRAWIGFHDQLVHAWLADHALSEQDVLDWTLRQLDHLAVEVLGIRLQ